MTPQNANSTPEDIDIMTLWRAVMDRKKALFLSSLGVGALTFLALSLVTPQYTSTTRLIIENDQSVYDRPTGQQGQSTDVVALLDKEAVMSQVQVLRSNDLALGVIEKLRLSLLPEFNSGLKPSGFLSSLTGGPKGTEEERVLRAFNDARTVYPIKDSRIIAVDVTSEDPVLASRAANALAEGYLQWQRGRQADQTKDETESLGRQLDALKAKVEDADFKLEKFRSETGLYAGQNNTTLSQQQLSEINSQLSIAKAQRSEAEARAKQIREMLRNGTVDAAPDVLRSQLIQRLAEQRVGVQRRVSELAATLRNGHPQMRQVRSELGTIDRQIRAEVQKIVRGLENEARIASAREQSLRASLDEVRAQASKTGNDQVRLTLLEREAQSKRELYEATIRKFDEARSASARRNQPVFARVVETARATSIPSFPQKVPMAIFAAVATLLLGLAWVVTRALLAAARPELVGGDAAPAINSPFAEQASASPAPQGIAASGLVGAGATAAAAGDLARSELTGFAGAERNGDDPLARSRTGRIAAMLLARGDGKPGYRTMVTAMEDGERVDETAMEIAGHLAAARARTIVVSLDSATSDDDTRGAAAGLTDVLVGRAILADAVRHQASVGVDRLDAGASAFAWSDAANALAANRFFDSLDTDYDQVIVTGARDVAAAVFRLIEGRFDHGVAIGIGAESARDEGYFLGYHIPDFAVATLEPQQRVSRSEVRARYAPQPGLTIRTPAPGARNGV